MKIYLAPMEGLADHFLRKLIAKAGGYDLVFTEFVRVVDLLLPKHVFLKQAPELLESGYTESGTPIRVQLLGSNPKALALNAIRACELGSHGIDLNFGCPSKTVNSSKGGAALLKEPDTIYQVVKSVRDAMPSDQPLSAKMRLGFDDETLMWECAHAIADAGAGEIIIHARTKTQGYKPPAYWHKAVLIEQKLKIPLVINGEIWTPLDAKKACEEANATSIMLGRGAIRNPYLASEILGLRPATQWHDISPLIANFWQDVTSNMPSRYCSGRLKQWLTILKVGYEPAEELFNTIRAQSEPNEIGAILRERLISN